MEEQLIASNVALSTDTMVNATMARKLQGHKKYTPYTSADQTTVLYHDF